MVKSQSQHKDDLDFSEESLSLSKEEQEELRQLEELEAQRIRAQELRRQRKRLEELRARHAPSLQPSYDVDDIQPMDSKQKIILLVLFLILCAGAGYITFTFFIN